MYVEEENKVMRLNTSDQLIIKLTQKHYLNANKLDVKIQNGKKYAHD